MSSSALRRSLSSPTLIILLVVIPFGGSLIIVFVIYQSETSSKFNLGLSVMLENEIIFICKVFFFISYIPISCVKNFVFSVNNKDVYTNCINLIINHFNIFYL
ncbi:putative IIV6_326L-like protein [Cricket iridovirus]|nr:putative IIV6_326L-like protein [Cricket iridovirus]